MWRAFLALSLVVPAVVLRHILQGLRLSIGGANGSDGAFVPVLSSEVMVVVGRVYLLFLCPLKVVSGKIFSEKLALLEFKNFVSDPFGLDSLNHCSGFEVRCSSDSSVLPIKIDGDGQDEASLADVATCFLDEGVYQKTFGLDLDPALEEVMRMNAYSGGICTIENILGPMSLQMAASIETEHKFMKQIKCADILVDGKGNEQKSQRT
ncbi:hypothetical protein Acr_13g0006270 [Actinidia rufa]|uniref:Uncharacterized protein n=1 Tax=Actinidia rufa TaxID=165716 RepID=A0A7J0FLF5_9ERIC|nr:hypothetical protein Acr_13g0006270 [Actinidia rufa]